MDALFLLPIRYQDRTKITPISSLEAKNEALVDGSILKTNVVFGRRRSLLCTIQDQTGTLTLRFFHFRLTQKNRLKEGTRIRVFGEVRQGTVALEMIHPEVSLVDSQPPLLLETSLTPFYPSVKGLNQKTLRKLTEQALQILKQEHQQSPQEMPKANMKSIVKPNLYEVLEYLHRPPSNADTVSLQTRQHLFQKHLAFEELVAHQISLSCSRAKERSFKAPTFKTNDLRNKLLEKFDFKLTEAQSCAIAEIDCDLKTNHPMLRLLQGDVGSGKTAVAATVASSVLEGGSQVVLMAPTELLAEQHYATLTAWFVPLGLEVVMLTGRAGASERKVILQQVAQKKPLLIVGTHALFQKNVTYASLGLIIVDEQHRFGVEQRLALRQKGSTDEIRPHQLIMTATPIPRTLAMTAYADLDISTIDQLPPTRQPVRTTVVPETKRIQVIERVRHVLKEGKQAYWVCPFIEESDLTEHKAATKVALELKKILPSVNVDLVHGRQADQEQETAMSNFAAGKTNILVATTVIEVGVDVPNASLIVIENAERLGLSQLHQLRGRVGRGIHSSDCVLIYKGPLSPTAKERLATIRHSNDGFEIAEKDLVLRGPGELLGTQQAGVARYRIADLERDREMLGKVRRKAKNLLTKSPAVATAIVRRWLGPGLGEKGI